MILTYHRFSQRLASAGQSASSEHTILSTLIHWHSSIDIWKVKREHCLMDQQSNILKSSSNHADLNPLSDTKSYGINKRMLVSVSSLSLLKIRKDYISMFSFFRKNLASENVYLRIATTCFLFVIMFFTIKQSAIFFFPRAYSAARTLFKTGIHQTMYLLPLCRYFYLISYL